MNWRYWLSWVVPVRMETRYRSDGHRWYSTWWQWAGRPYAATWERVD